jgi:hypothetical protein
MFVNFEFLKSPRLTKYIENPPTFFHCKNTSTICVHALQVALQYHNVPFFSHEKSLLENSPILNILGNDSILSPPLLLLIHFLRRPYDKAHFIPIKN